jgi:hypothetical protein
MKKTALLSSGAVLVLGVALPCAAAGLPSVATPAQVTALPAVTTATTALPVLPAVAATPSAGAGLGRAVNRRQALPGLDGLDTGVQPVRNISIRPIRVPPGIATPPLSIP